MGKMSRGLFLLYFSQRTERDLRNERLPSGRFEGREESTVVHNNKKHFNFRYLADMKQKIHHSTTQR